MTLRMPGSSVNGDALSTNLSGALFPVTLWATDILCREEPDEICHGTGHDRHASRAFFPLHLRTPYTRRASP